MTDSDGAHIFPPRADDQRIIDAIAAQGGPFGFGIDGDFRKALGNFLGLSDAEILAKSVDDMWKCYLDDQGLVNAAEPFSFDLISALPVAPQDSNQYVLKQAATNPEPLSGSFRYDWDFKPDGTKAYTLRNGTIATSSFREYDVAVPWSINNADWSNVSQTLIGGSNARTFQWSPDGTVLCTLQRWFSSNYRLINYDQSATPFASAVLGTATVGTNIATNAFNVQWRPDGLVVYVEHSGGIVNAQAVAVPFDATTITTTPLYTFDSTVDRGAGSFTMNFSADGLTVYSVTSTNLLCSWQLTVPYDLSTAFGFATGVDVNLPTNLGIPRGLVYRHDTGDIFLEQDQSTQHARCWSPAASPNIDEFVFDSEVSISGGLLTIPTAIWVSPDGLHLYATEETIASNHVFWHEMSVAHDLSTISVTANTGGDGQSVRGIALREDGTEMFTHWRNPTNPDGFFRWLLTGPNWDVTQKASRTQLNSPATGNTPTGLHFKADGTEMYSIDHGAGDDKIYQHTLSTPWDITTGTLTNTFDYTNEFTTAFGLVLTSDGAKMFVVDGTNTLIQQYNLSIPFDLSTAVYANRSLTLEQNTGVSPRDISIRDDNKLYVIYNTGAYVEKYVI